jgi:glutaredoxin
MRRTLPLGALALLVCATGAQAQLYKWVGPDGKVTYSDTPPPKSATRVETKALGADSVSTAGLPYELAEAVKNYPVTLYTTADCAPCNEGRNLLTQRGIPFAEKTVASREDSERYKKINSEGKFPFLTVGRGGERGFESSAWNQTLTAAGYPQSSRLPQGYRNPQAEPVAGEAKPVSAKARSSNKEATNAATTPDELPSAIGNAPPGFRF